MKAKFMAPQLATLTKKVFSDAEWIFEEKFDGIRCIAVRSDGKVSLFSRNRKTISRDFPNIVKALEGKGKDFVADGEIVALTGKMSSFSRLQQRKKEKVKIDFFVFDLLLWDGKDLRKEPLLERKKKLKAVFPFHDGVHYTKHVKKNGEAEFKKACKKGSEGVIAKKGDSQYRSKRTRDWLKFKCTSGQELVIGGYTEPEGARIGFGALLVGYYNREGFHYAGKVGTGYDTQLLRSLSKKLKQLERGSSPFITPLKEAKAHFVRPTLVCEVRFTEWTREGKLRHPRFLGLRKDKPAKSVVRET